LEKYRPLIYNYAYRLGPVVVVGLDTGEDRPDNFPNWGGTADFDRQRALQAEWLDETLSRPEIASAPFVVAVCHIPIFPILPDDEMGDIFENCAYCQSLCGKLWGPVLNKHKVQVVVAGHLHDLYPAEKADSTRTWTQMHCGGPKEGNRSLIRAAVEKQPPHPPPRTPPQRRLRRRTNLQTAVLNSHLWKEKRNTRI